MGAPELQRIAWLTAVVAALHPGVGAGQEGPVEVEAVLDAARSRQVAFERTRLRHLPMAHGGSGGRCDEIIGRLCIWDGGDDDWTPDPEAPEIIEARTRLIHVLDSLGALAPGEPWILAQRIRYRVEAGDLEGAAVLSSRCGIAEPWRCDAYLGLVRHVSGEVEAATRAFERALSSMPAELAETWRDPEPLLDSELNDWIADQPDSARAADALWRLADPLFMRDGNDRWTGHLSRWAWSLASERTRSPHQLNWGKDLTETVVRYGWPIAWEQPWPTIGSAQRPSAIGHDPPRAARFYPSRRELEGPDEDEDWVQWRLTREGMTSLYLPPYVDSMRTLTPQIGRFRLPGGMRFIASADLAGLGEAGHDSLQVGLFVRDMEGADAAGTGRIRSDDVIHAEVRIDAGTTPGIVSFEVLDPVTRRAARGRFSVDLQPLPEDVVSLSDIVLLEAGSEPGSANELASVLRPSLQLGPDERVTVAFEVYGLGYRQEDVQFSLSVERARQGFFSRAAGWIGLGGDDEPLAVAWSQPGPETPEPMLEYLHLDLPGLDEGDYDLVVEIETRGRFPAERRRRITVLEDPSAR